MIQKISVVINTCNEERDIARVIKSVQWADEILVCDMQSEDDTAVIAKRLGARVIFHKRMSYVEPARNFAISKALHDWVLVLDPDEEVPESLANRMREQVGSNSVVTYVEIPRKNMIFGKWIKASGWWPDYVIRFFKKNSVVWSGVIHVAPKTLGQGLKLPPEERLAIIHHNYTSISQYLGKLNRYTDVQAKDLIHGGYKFNWVDLIRKPLGEFLSRYFATKGYEDGVHGLVLSLLQAFSFLVVYIKIWEMDGFKEKDLKFSEVKVEFKTASKEVDYWLKYGNLSKNLLKRFMQRAANRL